MADNRPTMTFTCDEPSQGRSRRDAADGAHLSYARHEHKHSAGPLRVVHVRKQLLQKVVIDDGLVQPRERLARFLAIGVILAGPGASLMRQRRARLLAESRTSAGSYDLLSALYPPSRAHSSSP